MDLMITTPYSQEEDLEMKKLPVIFLIFISLVTSLFTFYTLVGDAIMFKFELVTYLNKSFLT